MYFNTIGGGGGSASYEIDKSLRLRKSASARLSRSFTGSGYTTATISTWVKRSELNVGQSIVHSYATANDFFSIHFNAANQLYIYEDNNATDYGYIFNDVFRDPAAHFHIVVVLDSTNATAADRFRCYINGVRLTSINTNYGDVPLNYSFRMFNSTFSNYIGYNQDQNAYFDGYVSEFNFIDGLALDASAFGEFNVETGQWVPKKYSGAYGTNGFYLDFKDNSNLTNLCLDKSGNGNHWTATNVSLTAGTTYDSILDTPTNNFATLNPIDTHTGSVVSNGGLTQTATAGRRAAASIRIQTGSKIYAEFINSSAHNSSIGIGFGVSHDSVPNSGEYNAVGSYHFYASNGAYIINNGTLTAIASETNVANQTYQVAADASNGKVWIGQNNVWWDSTGGSTGNPSTGANPTFTIDPSGFKIFSFIDSYISMAWDVNFGQRGFNFTPPTGYKALCTKNLPIPTIINPQSHFDAITWVGTSTSAARTFTGLQFKPDLVWGKVRSAAGSHTLFDSVRGTGKTLRSNTTDSEVANEPGGYVSSFNSDGFSTTPGSIDNWYWNLTGGSFSGWLWKAGGAPVSNTAGSITSQVSANQQAGFSIVTYTGNANLSATVGHGLGVAPALVIVKLLNGAGGSWQTYHRSIGPSAALYLDLTLPSQTASGFWNNTPPTTSVISIGNSGSANVSAGTHVAYCFAEVPGYSKIGSYVGNGSTDGPFVWCGFKPRFVLIKRTDVAANWVIYDTSRDKLNPMKSDLYPNLALAEDVGGPVLDFVSNGFKVRAAGPTHNAAGGTYIYYAVAEAPFQYANAR